MTRQYEGDDVVRAVVKKAVQQYYPGATVLGRVTLYERIVGDPALCAALPNARFQSRAVVLTRITRALNHYGCRRRNNHYRSNGVDLSPMIFEPLTHDERARLEAQREGVSA